MSQPREIIPGTTYLITRRALRRHLLLRPDPAINQLIVYTLAVAAGRHGIQVHAFCAMSTHLHLVVTDVRGVLPRFLQFFHRLVALGAKVLRAWEGPLWDHESTSVVRLWTRASVVEKMAYVLANPVAAGLVQHASDWPGAKVRVDELGRGMLRAKRPLVYFDPTNPEWPEEATLPITLPPAILPHGAAGFRHEVEGELARQETCAHAELQKQGIRFWGAERASEVSPYERAKSVEKTRERNPTFAVGRGQGDAWSLAAASVRAFRARYRDALDKWRAGVRSAVFPMGTWWMRAFHGASTCNIVLAT